MRKFLATAAMILVSQIVFGLGDSTPGSDGRGSVRCAAYDSGYEEHGNHRTCGECFGKHDSCVMKCFDYTYTCTVIGVTQRRDPNGRIIQINESFPAEGFTEMDARNSAQNRCYRSGALSCGYPSCSENAHLRDSYACQKEVPRH